MKKERQSNFELLRIILMIAIPTYHLMVYSGMNNLPYNELTIPSLLLCSGSAIVADYAFMALSSYFFLEMIDKPVLPRFVKTISQVLFILAIKCLVLFGILSIPIDNGFYQSFFIRGSWWFIVIYLIILLIYPFLNKIIFALEIRRLRMVCMILGVWFLYCAITYSDSMINDLLCFIFIYFVMGYLKRTDFKTYFGLKNQKSVMILIYVVLYLLTFALCIFVKMSDYLWDAETSGNIVRQIIGKYSFPQFIMGIAVFLLFRSITIPTNRMINNFAKNTFYVFLLHETVMAAFWHFDKLIIVDGILPYNSVISMIAWCGIYLICSFVFAILIHWIYEHTVKIFVDKFLGFIANKNLIDDRR